VEMYYELSFGANECSYRMAEGTSGLYEVGQARDECSILERKERLATMAGTVNRSESILENVPDGDFRAYRIGTVPSCSVPNRSPAEGGQRVKGLRRGSWRCWFVLVVQFVGIEVVTRTELAQLTLLSQSILM
jgi:hypothetical protein